MVRPTPPLAARRAAPLRWQRCVARSSVLPAHPPRPAPLARTGYFPDGVGNKPWSNGASNAVNEFYQAKAQWCSQPLLLRLHTDATARS